MNKSEFISLLNFDSQNVELLKYQLERNPKPNFQRYNFGSK